MEEKLRFAHPRMVELRAWAVHFYTGLGLALGFLALIAAAEGRAWEVALIMGLAMFIDGTDGMLARRWQVSRWLPFCALHLHGAASAVGVEHPADPPHLR